MSPDTTTLSERLSGYLRTLEAQDWIRCQWIGGMRLESGERVLGMEDGVVLAPFLPYADEAITWDFRFKPSAPRLDLDNPLTVLGALFLFREASGDEGAYTYRVAPGCWEVRWRVPGCPEQRTVGGGVTEAHALVNAFEVLVNEIQR